MLLSFNLNLTNGPIDNRKTLNMRQLFRNIVDIYIQTATAVVIMSAFRNSSALKYYVSADYTHCLSVLVFSLLELHYIDAMQLLQCALLLWSTVLHLY